MDRRNFCKNVGLLSAAAMLPNLPVIASEEKLVSPFYPELGQFKYSSLELLGLGHSSIYVNGNEDVYLYISCFYENGEEEYCINLKRDVSLVNEFIRDKKVDLNNIELGRKGFDLDIDKWNKFFFSLQTFTSIDNGKNYFILSDGQKIKMIRQTQYSTKLGDMEIGQTSILWYPDYPEGYVEGKLKKAIENMKNKKGN